MTIQQFRLIRIPWPKVIFRPFCKLRERDKKIIEDIKKTIDACLLLNPDLTFKSLMNKLNQSEASNAFVSSEIFPQHHKIYQALVLHFKSLVKTDYHCHLGMGMNAQEISSLICKFSKEELEIALRNMQQNSLSGYRGLITRIMQFIPVRILRCQAIMYFMIRISGVLRNWKSANFYIVSPKALHQAVVEVASNYLRDNVRNFSLRLNPYRTELFSKDTSIASVFIETLNIIVAALDETAALFNCDKNSLTITLSLNREKETIYFENSTKIFGIWNEFPKEITDRVKGFDLSGPEIDNNNISVADWLNLLRQSDVNLEFTPHLGDIRNLKSNTPLFNMWVNYLTTNDVLFLLELIENHFEFIKKYIDLMPENSSIAHGISLSDKIIFLRPVVVKNLIERKVFIVDLLKSYVQEECEVKRVSILAKLNNLRQIILKKKIRIYFCPTTTTKSLNMNDFQRLPIFDWITNTKLNVKIGVDGLYQYPHKTLSEELTKLFITTPKFSRVLTYQEVKSLI